MLKAEFDPQLLLTESIENILQKSLGRVIESGIARLLPVTAPDQVAKKFQLSPNSLALYIVQTDYSAADEPLAYFCEYHLPDAFDFVVWRPGPTRLGGSSKEGR
jgi:GntR family transcriptional regulator